ncbi:hypothetical protein [Chelatococcus reniformis]|uniref:Uncharacterized protein n=1 Tax=Chelatococcus reniformis TaxID=1494448 RepID=A0A916U3Y5_9HYPH|nr:hypothetical protein [Chelatococcus reniformis]GGC58380.1 hypothetical protein GCM10010994_16650 [Chelatococcus reniformis]
MRILGTTAAGLALALSASAAIAQPAAWNRQEPTRYSDSYQRTYADGRICQRICPGDNQPCDPINFKIADARCNPNFQGR